MDLTQMQEEYRKKRQITKGPGKFDFLMAFAEGDYTRKRVVEFTLKGNIKTRVVLLTLGHGQWHTGSEFYFQGQEMESHLMVEGSYSTKSGRGEIIAVEQLSPVVNDVLKP